MESISNTLVIQEKDLELVISSQKLGSLTTNAKDIKALVEKALPNYDVANYNESNIEQAKKDKAMLNNAAKALNSKRIELEKEFNKPFDEFKSLITDTVKLIGDCSAKIDSVVKESDEKEKGFKRDAIIEYWNSKNFKLVPIEKVFDDKWLNKTTKMKDIHSDIDSKIDKINDDIVTIEAIGTDVDLLKSLYLDTLNLNSTIQYANTLKNNRETAQREAKERTASVECSPEAVEEENPFKESTEASTEVPATTEAPDKKALHIITMKVTGTYDQMVALSNFMNENSITFEKISND
ncbi:DUF1351 domain-containing protein [Flavobacterium sp. 25HG05S-40]|uniref:DUF1351 domain-containing protein n=1 Tax=Flavobacterium sp. 25HG05S-40 TaxID=3458682 RepID=UPI004044005F